MSDDNNNVAEQPGTAPLKIEAFEKPGVRQDVARIEAGADVFFKVRHLHGIHGRVLDGIKGSYLVRIMEEGFEGHVVLFSASDLVPADLLKLKESPSTRLPMDYED